MAKSILVGSWGGTCGQSSWSYKAEGVISKITLTYSDAIYSIIFASKDKDGKWHTSRQFGSQTGQFKEEIDLDKTSDTLTGISGTYGMYRNYVVVTSLSFFTGKGKHMGPFGYASGEFFTLFLEDGVFDGFHGQSGGWLDSIGASLEYVQQKSIAAGPWGGSLGDPWEYKPVGVISQIDVTYEDYAIYSIIFTSKDKDGNISVSDKFGSQVGSSNRKIVIDTETDALDGISGTYGTYRDGKTIVTSLSFSTIKQGVIGPFGKAYGTTFSQPADGGVFVEFFGRHGWWLDAIGVFLDHDKEFLIKPWGGTGGEAFSYTLEGVLSKITITLDEHIYSIMFTSKDSNGDQHVSPKFGSGVGYISTEITINTENETLNGISGTYGIFDSKLIVTSLSFSSNLRDVIGPFGSPKGTTFSLPIKEGVITGFHGRSGYWIDSIGVYLKPI